MGMTDHEDVRWFNLFVEEHYMPLLGFIRAATRNPHEAEDVCQEVFVATWLKRRILLVHPQPRGWLHKAARFSLAERKRRGARDARLLAKIRATSGSLAERLGSNPAELIRDEREEKEIWHQVERLPEGERDMVRLVMQGLSRTEVAGQLGITENAVNIRLWRARQRLRRALGL